MPYRCCSSCRGVSLPRWEWLETALTDAEQDHESAIDAEARVFDDWRGEGTPTRGELLRGKIRHADVPRQFHRAAKERAWGPDRGCLEGGVP